MAKKVQNINNPKVGMSRARSINLLDQNTYTFMLNGQSVDESGNKLTLSNEHSNILASKFKEGFVVMGQGTDIIAERTYFLLLNSTTNVSEFGFIQNDRSFSELQDTVNTNNCTECDNSNTLASPLENVTQTAHQTYTTLLNDACNQCLDLDINSPIKNLTIKRENIGTVAVFSDDRNVPRIIEIDNLEQYGFIGEEVCGTSTRINTCLDCDKLRVFKLYNYPKTENHQRVIGGNLKMGMYEAVFAYCDQLGNELSSYISLSTPVSIFDENNIIHEQADNDAETSFAIKYDLSELDQRYTHYKIVVIYNTNQTISETSSVRYELGVFSTSSNSFIISNNEGPSVSANDILIPKRSIKSWKGQTESNGILFGYGVREHETINLQPIANLLGLSLRWQSTIAKEELYAAANSNQYKGYNRDEVVAFGFEPISSDGYKYPIYPLIPRPSNTSERESVGTGETIDNKDTQSILSTVSNCDNTVRNKRWQFYNTSVLEGACTTNVPSTPQQQVITATTSVAVPPAPAGTIDIELEEENLFTGLKDYIENNMDSCSTPSTSPIEDICPFITLSNLTAHNNVPSQQTDCGVFTLDTEFVVIESIVNENSTKVAKPTSEYSQLPPPQSCNIHEIDPATNTLKIDNDFSYAFNVDSWSGGTPVISTKTRNLAVYNTSCTSATDLFLATGNNLGLANFGSYYHLNRGADTVTELQTSKTVSATATGFTSNLHEGALWFKTRVNNRDKFFIEISRETGCTGSSVATGNNEVRISVFDTCSAQTSVLSQIVDLSSHHLIELNNTLISALTTDTVFIAVDVPIVASQGYGSGYTTGDFTNAPTARQRLAPLCGCFNIVDRSEEFTKITVSYDSINISKTQRYNATCTINVPIANECEPMPYQYGDFGYYESTEKYPDNSELYNSSTLDIRPTDFSDVNFRTRFEQEYVNTIGATYELSDETNFTCDPIRHFRMPSNRITPFMSTTSGLATSEAVIYPLGVHINNSVINSFLDIAVRNNLISQERRNKIIGYKIHRGDATLSRSIQSSGLLFDMKTATKDEQEYKFSNFPYNANGLDKLYEDVTPSTNQNYLWTLHSPETDYFRPSLAPEVSFQGYQFGNSKGYFDEVEDHEKMVILGNSARSLATTLAIIEVTSEIVIQAAIASSNAQVWAITGVSNGLSTGGPAFTASAVIAGIGVLSGGISRVGRFRYEWLQSFRDLGTPKNFGYYYSSVGNYNQFTANTSTEDNLRGLSIRRYLKEGIFSVQDVSSGEQILINNLDRERSVLLSSSSSHNITYDATYFSTDNNTTDPNQSSQPIASETTCMEGLSEEINRKVASPYVALKTYIPNQYGTVDSIVWKDTGYQGDLRDANDCEVILGGDTFISRHTIKRKMRMFRTDAFNVGDLTPFAYRLLSNVSNARYYIDYEVLSEGNVGSTLFPNIDYDIETDCGTSTSGFYVEPPKKFYLYYYGIPSFLTETRVNTNFRNARKEPENQFYPQNLDYLNLTQEKNVSIRRPNTFFYNSAYSFEGTSFVNFTLPDYYSKEVFDKQSNNPNTVMYSRQDINENSLTEPWLVYRPNDYYVFPASYGELRTLKGIENDQVLGVFDNRSIIFNAVDVFVNGIDQTNTQFGTGGVFAKRPRTFSETDLGYIGSQTDEVLSTEFGHFIVDAKRGQVFNIGVNGQSVEEISRYSGGKPNGMDVWFKEHLPFKILRDFPEFTEYLDNSYNGVGITIGWDSKFRRVIITKKDYVKVGNITFSNGVFTRNNITYTIQQAINDSTLLKDVSWTITYKPEKGSWESYMDYKPNYYVNHSDYFQSGINQSSDSTEFGLWSHLLTHRSKQVFYGKKYPWIIEYPTKNEFISKKLQGIQLYTEAKRYHNEYDYSADDRITFNKAMIFSDRENSGNLNLVVNNGAVNQLSKYPITRTNEQDILITQSNKKWSFNYFFNRVKSNRNNVPLFTWDENQINKTINPQAVSFYGKNVLEILSSDVFLVRLQQDKTSQYDMELKFTIQKEEISEP